MNRIWGYIFTSFVLFLMGCILGLCLEIVEILREVYK